jgi:uncharacterized membrane protein
MAVTARRIWISADLALAVAVIVSASPVRADLKLCNRLSYAVETAIAIEDKGAGATRGWFRIDPGQCRNVVQGSIEAEHLYVHARALSLYGPSPLPQTGHTDLCVAHGNFVIAGARVCRPGQQLARFTAIKPAESEDGLIAKLAEEADYTDDQARLAGIQRLLVVAGYDANPIDGLLGPRTDAALGQFLKDRNLPSEAANGAGFFDVLIDAAQRPATTGFSWCNDTGHAVMAALGVEEKSAVVTRGWYRVEPGKCLRPEVRGHPRRLYSFAEAVGADGQPIRQGDKSLAWGGDTMLCTQEVKFELSEHRDCAVAGLTAAGFGLVDLAGRAGATVRFRE